MRTPPRSLGCSLPRVGAGLGALVLALGGCTIDRVPRGFGATPAGDGPQLRHDPSHVPRDVAFPNDLFTVPDPSSPTGLRVNVGAAAPSPLLGALLDDLNRQPGFGVTAPLTVPLTHPSPDPAVAPLDLVALLARHGPSLDPADDAVYLIDLDDGTLVPLDLGVRSATSLVRDEQRYRLDDPRRREPTLELETVDERVDPVSGLPDPARTTYLPAIDGDADGLLDIPNLLDPEACQQTKPSDPGTPEDDLRDRCLADNLVPFFERDGDTLVLRPLVPLSGATRYAVVLTDRLVDTAGSPIRSPFDTVFHPAQRATAERVADLLGDPDATARFGELAGSGLEHVAFTWSFTTAPVLEELSSLVDGLAGRGAHAELASSFPPTLTATRVVGPIPQAELDAGESEPADWETSDDCAPLLDRPFAIDGAVLRERLGSVSPEVLGLTRPSQQAALVASLEAVSHVALAQLEAPFYLAGGPSSTAPGAAFDPAVLRGDRAPEPDRIPVWVFVPRAVEDRFAQPFDAVVYAHGYGGSALEALSVAGALAAQGLATVAFDAPGHGPDAVWTAALDSLLRPTCHARGLTAALASRARDLDGDGDREDDSGGDARNGDVAHVRDVVRQTALDLVAVVRALRAAAGSTPSESLDYDDDGVRDVGGRSARVSIFGRSLGGAAAILAGPMLPEVTAIAALGAPGTLVDPWLRTADPTAFATFTGAWLGPAIQGIPVSELADADTRCSTSQTSLRLTAVDGGTERSLEFGCVELAGTGVPAAGGTAVVTNVETLERRCTRIARSGRFRVPIPAAAGDQLHVVLLDRPDAVATYDPDAGCEVPADAPRILTRYQWGEGPVPSGTTDERGRVLCSVAGGCTPFQGQLIPSGAPLRALSGGAGLIRQSPNLRRWLDLARHVAAAGDPAAVAPQLGLPPRTAGSQQAPRPPTATLLLTPVGSLEVPVDVQVRLARAAGILPFLDPEATDAVPELADYATPAPLFAELGEATPLELLVASGVVEGIPRLARAAPAGSCGANERSQQDAPECHPGCTADDDCPTPQICDDTLGGYCRLADASPEICATTLADPDALDEGLARDGALEAAPPLRLARIAASVGAEGPEAVWEPRLVGRPFGADFGAWAADKATLAVVFPYLSPTGRDSIVAGDDCTAFDADRYLLGLVGRFLSTSGLDVRYLSHPATHRCLADQTCDFFPASR